MAEPTAEGQEPKKRTGAMVGLGCLGAMVLIAGFAGAMFIVFYAGITYGPFMARQVTESDKIYESVLQFLAFCCAVAGVFLAVRLFIAAGENSPRPERPPQPPN